MKNLLFICTTEFQLLTALNMKVNVYKDDIADIIVDNYHGEERALADRIKETNLFRHVCFVNSHIEQKTFHSYLRGISDGKKNVTLGASLKNSVYFIWSMVKTLFSGDQGWLSVLVNGFHNLTFSDYDTFFGYGGKPVTRHARKYLEVINPDCHVVQFDEGVASYCFKNVGENDQINACVLYEPQLVQFSADIKSIPAISKENKSFVNIVNQVFEYDITRSLDLRDSVIFFDQGVSDPMPRYLRNASFIKKLIFHNSYRRHKKEEEKYKKWNQLTLEMLKVVGEKNIWVKPHPRSGKEALSMFADMPNVNILPQYQVPWEIIALNSIVDNSVLITFFSSSTCLYNSVINQPGNNKSVLLYKIGKLSINKSVISYFEELSQRFSNSVFIPKDKEEYISFWT